jgi:hypothetical protein
MLFFPEDDNREATSVSVQAFLYFSIMFPMARRNISIGIPAFFLTNSLFHLFDTVQAVSVRFAF